MFSFILQYLCFQRAVWILNNDLVNISIHMTFMYVYYEMNYLTEMQTVELEKAGLH